jgi:hypothetical protein
MRWLCNFVCKYRGVLSVTEVIFDPHFHRRETVLKIAEAVGFKEKNFFGKKLAYTKHFEKPATKY